MEPHASRKVLADGSERFLSDLIGSGINACENIPEDKRSQQSDTIGSQQKVTEDSEFLG